VCIGQLSVWFASTNQGEILTGNENAIMGKWLELKGDITAIGGLIQQKYGEALKI